MAAGRKASTFYNIGSTGEYDMIGLRSQMTKLTTEAVPKPSLVDNMTYDIHTDLKHRIIYFTEQERMARVDDKLRQWLSEKTSF